MVARNSLTKKSLILEIHRFIKEKGRVPIASEMKRKFGYPNYTSYHNVFGSWKNALVEAGIKPNTFRGVTKEFLISEVHRFIREHRRVPFKEDMNSKNGYPHFCTFQRKFGSWNNALREAKVEINQERNYSKEDIISSIKQYVLDNNKTPKYEDMARNKGYVPGCEVVRKFGSFNDGLKAANLPVNKLNQIHSEIDFCSLCGSHESLPNWYYNENENLVCNRCYNKTWRKNNEDKILITQAKRRNFGFVAINQKFKYSHAHHLHLENTSDFVVYVPVFLHQLHWHSCTKLETMNTPNALALDFWINQKFYNQLFK